MKQIIISTILIIIFLSCSVKDSDHDFIKGDWYYFERFETSAVNDDFETDSTYINLVYTEIYFDGQKIYSYDFISGALYPKLYKISNDSIYFYDDSVEIENIYFRATIKKLNDSTVIIKNDSLNYELTRIDEKEYTYSDELKFIDSISKFKSNIILYDSLSKNRSLKYHQLFHARELDHRKK